MFKFAMGLEYDGTAFSGWQAQESGVGIQEQVESALSKVADHSIKVVCAGRTDAGVHAVDQVVHFDTTAARNDRSWLLGTNSNLPQEINVTWVKRVDQTFHARYRAVSRRYRYVILNRRVRSSLMRDRATWWIRPLDEQLMHGAAQILLGERDFTSFRAVACQAKSPIRIIEEISVHRNEDFVVLDIRANGFLHHMVRNIAGSLIAIGEGVRPVSWISELLECRDRRSAGITAPATGLFFMQAYYDARFDLPTRSPIAAIDQL